MPVRVATYLYVISLVLLLMRNVITMAFALVGITGVAFYHIHAVVLLLCAVQSGLLLSSGAVRIKHDRNLVTALALTLAYAVVSGLLLLRFNDVVPVYAIVLIYSAVFYPGTAFLLLVCSRDEALQSEDREVIPKQLIWVCVAVLGFAWLQFVAGDPLLSITNSNEVSKLAPAEYLGTFRPPSVFEASFQLGLFAVFVFCLSAARIVCDVRNTAAWALALLAASVVAISQTRNIYLCALCASLSLFLMWRIRNTGRGKRLFVVTPWIYAFTALCALAWISYKFVTSGLARTYDLADASSTWSRVSGWQRALTELVIPGSLFDVLFGYGITQPGPATDFSNIYPLRGDGLFIDNIYVNIFLMQGLIGVVLFLTVYWMVWRRLLARLQSADSFTLGLTAFFSTFLAVGVFNIVIQWWGIALSLALIVLRNKEASGSPNIYGAGCVLEGNCQ